MEKQTSKSDEEITPKMIDEICNLSERSYDKIFNDGFKEATKRIQGLIDKQIELIEDVKNDYRVEQIEVKFCDSKIKELLKLKQKINSGDEIE